MCVPLYTAQRIAQRPRRRVGSSTALKLAASLVAVVGYAAFLAEIIYATSDDAQLDRLDAVFVAFQGISTIGLGGTSLSPRPYRFGSMKRCGLGNGLPQVGLQVLAHMRMGMRIPCPWCAWACPHVHVHAHVPCFGIQNANRSSLRTFPFVLVLRCAHRGFLFFRASPWLRLFAN